MKVERCLVKCEGRQASFLSRPRLQLANRHAVLHVVAIQPAEVHIDVGDDIRRVWFSSWQAGRLAPPDACPRHGSGEHGPPFIERHVPPGIAASPPAPPLDPRLATTASTPCTGSRTRRSESCTRQFRSARTSRWRAVFLMRRCSRRSRRSDRGSLCT